MKYYRDRAEKILYALEREVDYLASQRRLAEVVIATGAAYTEAIQTSARAAAEARLDGSIEWAKEAMLMPPEELEWYPTANHLQLPIAQSRRILDSCEIVTDQLNSAIMEIREEIREREKDHR